jgi:hypothetical protein
MAIQFESHGCRITIQTIGAPENSCQGTDKDVSGQWSVLDFGLGLCSLVFGMWNLEFPLFLPGRQMVTQIFVHLLE